MLIPPAAAYQSTLAVVLLPLAVWSTISSLELIAARHSFLPGSPLGVDLASLTRGTIFPRILGSRFAAGPWLSIIAMVRLTAGLLAPVSEWIGLPQATGPLLAVTVACTIWLSILVGGSDGADKIALVACTAAGLIAAGQATNDRWLCLAGLAWGAGQATIAYATSGLTKLATGFWRDGTALTAVMSSYRSGHALAAAAVRLPGAAIGMAWAIMSVETLFPVALVVPQPISLGILGAMCAFHLATAVTMGLNTYPWAFAATYPCVLMANSILTG